MSVIGMSCQSSRVSICCSGQKTNREQHRRYLHNAHQPISETRIRLRKSRQSCRLELAGTTSQLWGFSDFAKAAVGWV